MNFWVHLSQTNFCKVRINPHNSHTPFIAMHAHNKVLLQVAIVALHKLKALVLEPERRINVSLAYCLVKCKTLSSVYISRQEQ